jgi:hypothetical protein
VGHLFWSKKYKQNLASEGHLFWSKKYKQNLERENSKEQVESF